MYKVGDVVWCIKDNSFLNSSHRIIGIREDGTLRVVQLTSPEKYRYRIDQNWGLSPNEVVSDEIYNSPLYKVMQESE